MSDEWRPISGVVGYEASSDGRIRSVDRVLINARGQRRTHRGVVLAEHVDGQGYRRVRLGRHGVDQRRTWPVHVLVAMAFHGPRPFPEAQARHRNGVPADCRPMNLRWGTRSQNALDSVEHGTHNQASKATCFRGHALVAPNLRANTARRGHRGCLACNRAATTLRHFAARGVTLNLAKVADRHFESIMEGGSRVRWDALLLQSARTG